jgi:hypothetical protein
MPAASEPTALQKRVVGQETAVNLPGWVARGARTRGRRQTTPFHISASGPDADWPTATHRRADGQLSAKSWLPARPAGVGSTDHVDPFHRSASNAAPATPGDPTAMQSRALGHATDVSWPVTYTNGAGTGSGCHCAAEAPGTSPSQPDPTKTALAIRPRNNDERSGSPRAVRIPIAHNTGRLPIASEVSRQAQPHRSRRCGSRMR